MAKPDSAWGRVAFVRCPLPPRASMIAIDCVTYIEEHVLAPRRMRRQERLALSDVRLVRATYLVAGEDVPLVAISVLHCAFKREGSVCEWETRSQRTMHTSLFP